ncbi:MAG: hypothetical protein AAFX87_21085 [Bacteroidota bacterium]
MEDHDHYHYGTEAGVSKQGGHGCHDLLAEVSVFTNLTLALMITALRDSPNALVPRASWNDGINAVPQVINRLTQK